MAKITKPKLLKNIFNSVMNTDTVNLLYDNPLEIEAYLEDELKTFETMYQTDSSIFAAIDTLKKAILKAEFKIEGNDAQAKFIQENLENIDPINFFESMLEALKFGYSVHGLEYELINGRYYLKKSTIWGYLGADVDDYGFNYNNELVYKGNLMNEVYPVLSKGRWENNFFVNSFSNIDASNYGFSLLAPLFWIWVFLCRMSC